MTKSLLQNSIDALPFRVPNGLVIAPASGREFYLSGSAPPPGLWARLRAHHPRSGLWPVFLQGHAGDAEHPWVSDDPGDRCSSGPEENDAEAVLRGQWDQCAEIGIVSARARAYFCRQTSPFAGRWPGLAPAVTPVTAPDEVADEVAERLIHDDDTRLGLVPVERGADVPVAVDWWAGDEIDAGSATAVLRSWEERFGARMIQFGFDSLELSIAAPPTTLADAEHLAAEHFALCVENIGREDGALTQYAEELIGSRHWSFWWDRETPDWLDPD